jgi:hypothetical protein
VASRKKELGQCPDGALMPGSETWWLSPTDTCGRPPQTAPLAQVSISDKAARNLWRMAVQSEAEIALGEAAQLGGPARRPKSRATIPRYQRIIRTLPSGPCSRSPCAEFVPARSRTKKHRLVTEAVAHRQRRFTLHESQPATVADNVGRLSLSVCDALCLSRWLTHIVVLRRSFAWVIRGPCRQRRLTRIGPLSIPLYAAASSLDDRDEREDE